LNHYGNSDSITHIKVALAGFKRGLRFIDYREFATLAHELRTMLQEIEENVNDPRLGVELVAAFLETTALCSKTVTSPMPISEKCKDLTLLRHLSLTLVDVRTKTGWQFSSWSYINVMNTEIGIGSLTVERNT
jgi:hypothetical protein